MRKLCALPADAVQGETHQARLGVECALLGSCLIIPGRGSWLIIQLGVPAGLGGAQPWSVLTYLCLPQQLLELVLGQQPVVLHERRHLGWPLCLVINRAVDLHVLVEDGQELLLALGRKAEV